jgi:hypothetical protein
VLARQELLGGAAHKAVVGDDDGEDDDEGESALCMTLPEHPVTVSPSDSFSPSPDFTVSCSIFRLMRQLSAL